MTHEDVIYMAREAGLFQHVPPTKHVLLLYDLMAFAALVAAAEREACAQVAEQWQVSVDYPEYQVDCATAIRTAHEVRNERVDT